jgi:hypothetical protein
MSVSSNCTAALPNEEILDAYVKSKAQAAVYTTAAVGLALALGAMVWIVWNRRQRVLHIASPLLFFIFVSGIATLIAAAVVSVQNQTSDLCNTQLWMYHMGISCAFGTLFLKTWRLARIFGNPGLDVVTISDGRLLLVLGAYVLIIATLLEVQAEMFPIIVLDNPRGRCVATRKVVNYFLAGMQTVMMCVGICVVYSARNIPTRYNESRLLAIATFSTGVICAIWFGLTWGLQKQIELVGSITAFQAMLSIVQSIFVLVLVIGPKMFELWRDQRKQMAERDESFAAATRSPGLSVSMSTLRKNLQGGRSDDAADDATGAVSMFLHQQNPDLAGASGSGGDGVEGEAVQRPVTEADVLARLKELLDLEQEEIASFKAAELAVREHKNKLIDLAQQVAEMRSSLQLVREDAPVLSLPSLRVAAAAPRSLRATQMTALPPEAASAHASDSARLRGAHETASDDVIVSEHVTDATRLA